ncbi:MAG TPA: sulfotransferase [Nitrospiria bacterium]|nr:sulfotransferase [Nitrospiria bacterium]
MSDHRIKVLYIGGSSRTGSTLFDRLLGQIDGFFSVGELRHIWERGFWENQLCGCGKPLNECEFWHAVIVEAFGGLPNVNAKEIWNLQRSLDRWWHIPRLLFDRKTSRFGERLEAYKKILSRLYRAIQKVSGCSVIVDSSKYPSHGIILNGMTDIELYPVHLVRDSRAVAFSWQKKWLKPEITWKREPMPNYNPFVCASEYIIMNMSLRIFKQINDRYFFLYYEDLANNPQEMVIRTLEKLGLPYPGLKFINDHTIFLKPNHTVSGNPMRFKQGVIEVRPDIDWKMKMKRSHRSLVTALTFPLLYNYGYVGRRKLYKKQ